MKTFFLATVYFLIMSSDVFSQTCIEQKDKTTLFNEYLSLFPTKNFPYKALWDFDNRTPFTVPLSSITKDLYKLFICDNGIKCKSDYCNPNKFFGFEALCQLPKKDNYILVIATNDTDAGCDEKWFLIAYTPEGEFVDKIWIFGKTYLKLSSETTQDRTYLEIESTILENEIILKAKKIDYQGNDKVITNYEYYYSISDKGKFIKIKGPDENFE